MASRAKRKDAPTESKTPPKKVRTSKTVIKAAPAPAPTPIVEVFTTATESNKIQFDDAASEAEASEDDQTVALLKGFDISPDASDDEEIQGADAPALDISTLPNPAVALQNSKSSAATSKSKSSESTGPTVLYLSRVPHGFYEPQMTSYFSQFGDIKRLRLARNRRTGASKHYAFIEFADAQVAQIVQKTMDNYLMFKHILKVRLVPDDQVHADLWKGAGKRFRKVPWNRIERSRVAGTDREGWNKRVKNEQKRRDEKKKKLEALGYNFEAPALRDVESVPKQLVQQEAVPAVENTDATVPLAVEAEGASGAEVAEGEQVKAIEDAPHGDSIVKKPAKKSKKRERSSQTSVPIEDGVKIAKGSKKIPVA